MQEAYADTRKEADYKRMLLESFSTELQNIEPGDTADSNLEWLWSRATRLGADNDEIRAVLCQLAIHFGVSALNTPCISQILNDAERDQHHRIQAMVDCLQN